LKFPVQTKAPERVLEIAGTSAAQVPLAVANPYSIFFTLSGQIDVTTALKPASLINPAGNIVAAGSESVLSALDDFANTSDYILLLGTLRAQFEFQSRTAGLTAPVRPSQEKERARGPWRPITACSST
jgi:hypothetical protein